MSYFDEANTGGNLGGYPDTPMLFDVYASQQIYGADMTTRTGNTIYGFGSNAGAAYNFSTNSAPGLCIWDAGGTDILDCSGFTQNQLINLTEGVFSNIGSLIGNVSIALGAVIENAVGGSGADTINGNSADNILTGKAGNDTISGGLGNDRAVFAGLRSAYTITDLGGGSVRVSGPDGTDTLSSIEFLVFDDMTMAWPPAVNQAPVITSGGGGDTAVLQVPENSSIAALVTAADPDAGTTLTYSIVGGDDQALFQINASTGKLSFINAPNFEAPADADHNNSYVVQIRVSDGSLFDTQTMTINVTNVNESLARPHDFGGDYFSDLLLRNDTGSLALWQMNGAQIVNSSDLGNVPISSQISGLADFNGDDKSDILWRNGSGDLELWLMNGAQTAGTFNLGTVYASSHIAGLADFNGDGKSDILWRNDNGVLGLWMMDGAQIQGGYNVSTVYASSHIAGLADFNGDGKSDILWRNDNGVLGLWLMDGPQIQGGFNLATVYDSSHIAGLGDFNGDSKSDIIWRNDNGLVALWLMDGAQITGGFGVASTTSDWHIIA
jgi:hypothetical protein